MPEAGIFVAAAVGSSVLVYAIRRFAQSLRLVDIPNERSMHGKPIPRGGGAAIVVVGLLGLAAGAGFGLGPQLPAFAGYLAGALLLAAVGLRDDVRSLPFGPRLAAQFVAAGLMVGCLALPGPGQVGPFGLGALGWLVVAAAILWTVGFSNAYNFMDGIDGLAATHGVVAGLGWALLAFVANEPWLALLSLLVAAGYGGFLVHNWPPARIFMGDVGSIVLGFTFAFILLAAARRMPVLAVAGVLLHWPFIFDTGFTLLRRLSRRENIFRAHRSHLYQRLVLAGWGPAAVTTLYALLSLPAIPLAFWLTTAPGPGPYPALAVIPLFGLGLWVLVIRAERRRAGDGDVDLMQT
jgi:UDP-N-acetylmuramyl pentapeptide phosphotransferase/UDP-N-acetylglucosamine-1-phosphate transferase